jgi:SAM-dependent methyltransferase
VVGERATPARLGWAVAVGILIGTSPFFGFHLVICLAAATLLGLNRTVTYLAANISGPWLAPLIIFGSVQTGHLILTGSWLPLRFEVFRTIDPWQFAEAWLLGGLAVGSTLGALAGLCTWRALEIHRRRHPLPHDPIEEKMAEVVARYRPMETRVWKYVRGKFRHDPVYRQIAGLCPLPGPVVDIGCGRGQALLLIAAMQAGVKGIGVDWSATRIEKARRAAGGLPSLAFEQGDIRSWPVPAAGTVLLIDVLHYNPAPAQDELLRRAARSLAPGGVIYIRDIDAGAGARAWVSCLQERIGRLLGFNRGTTLCFRPAAETVKVLEAEGLHAAEVPATTGLAFANVLLEARHAGEAARKPQAVAIA